MQAVQVYFISSIYSRADSKAKIQGVLKQS